MMNRVTRFNAILMLVAAILGAIWFAIPESDPERRERISDWSAVMAQPPSSIAMQRGNSRLVLARVEGANHASRYAATNYANIATDPAAVDRLIGALAHLETVRPIASADAHQGLDHPRVTIDLEGSDGKRSVALGAPAASPDGAHYASLTWNGQTQIVVLAATTARAIDVEPYGLLEHRVLDWVPSELRSVELRNVHGIVQLERSASGMWTLTSPPRGRARREAVQQLLLSLTELSLAQFVESRTVPPSQNDADAVELAVRARHEDRDVQVRLKLGGRCPSAEKGRLLIREGTERRMGCVDETVLRAFALKSTDVADNAAFSLHGDEVERLEVSGMGPIWTLTRDGAAFRVNGDSTQSIALLAGNTLLDSITAVRGRNIGTCTFVAKRVGPMLSLRSYVVGNDGPTDQRIQWAPGDATNDRQLCRDDGTELLISAEDARMLDVTQSMLRDPTLLNVSAEAITEVDLSGPAGHQRLRVSADGGFRAVIRSLGPVDNISAETLRESLAQLRALRWLAPVSGEARAGELAANVDFRVAKGAVTAPVVATSRATADSPDAGSAPSGIAAARGPTEVHHLRLAFRPAQPTIGWLDGIALPFVVEPGLAELVENLALDRTMLGLTDADRMVTLSRGPDQIRLERQAERWLVAGKDGAPIDPVAITSALEKLHVLSIEAPSTRHNEQRDNRAGRPLAIDYSTASGTALRVRLHFEVGPAIPWRGLTVHRVTTDAARVVLIVRATDLAALLAPFLRER